MSKTGTPKDSLEAAFAAARRHPPEPDAAFLARVLEDAETVQAEITAAGQAAPVPAPRDPWRGVRAVVRALGGWPAMAGLASAAVTGLWLGAAPPEALSETAQAVWAAEDTVLAFQPDLGTELFPAEEG